MKFIAPSDVHPARGYSHAVQTGNIIHVAGQVGIGMDNKVVAGGFEEQTKQALDNLASVLVAAGATLGDIVKLNTYVTSMDNIEAYRELRRAYFGDRFPASTLVQVAGLARPELMIEIEAVAVKE